MQRGKNKGFTIVEITLFVAISGLLIITAMITIGTKQQTVQFTDAMRTLQSFVETQVSATVNGVNDNPVDCGSTGGNSNSCVFLGRVMILNDDSSDIEYYSLLGDRLSADDEIACVDSLLECSNPVVESTIRMFNVPWGATFKVLNSRHTVDGAQEPSRAFAFVRNPRSSSISSVSYSNTSSTNSVLINGLIEDATQYGTVSTALIAEGEDVDAYYCFKSANGAQQAALTIKDSNVDLIFDHPDC